MSDLAEFLLARIEEFEAAAREAIAERDRIPWRPGMKPPPGMEAWFADEPIPHVAFDAELVLAECEAKRKIVEFWQNIDADETVAPNGQIEWGRAGAQASVYMTMRLLSLPYAGHPDYREEWRPRPEPTPMPIPRLPRDPEYSDDEPALLWWRRKRRSP